MATEGLSDPGRGAPLALHPSAGPILGFGDFRYDRTNRLLSRDGVQLALPPRVLGVLAQLVERPGAVVSKQQLMESVWKDAFVTETSLTEAVSLLRQALGDDPQRPRFVQTLHRRGYRFVAPVRVQGEAAAAARPRVTALGPHASPVLWASIAAALAVGVAAGAFLRPSLPSRSARLAIPLPASDPTEFRAFPSLALSPDGRQVVVALTRNGKSQLFLRAIDDFESKPLPGTEGASAPFVSADGQWIGFFAEGQLRKVPLAGGPAVTICDAMYPGGASWGPDGTIVFNGAARDGLWRVPARGGQPERLTRPSLSSGELSHNWPQVLPDGDTVLFTSWSAGGLDKARLAVLHLSDGGASPRVLIEGATFGRYASNGHLLFARKSRLMAVPFDLRRGAIQGEPTALLDGVAVSRFEGSAQYALSETGVLVYVPGSHEVLRHRLEILDSEGRSAGTALEGRAFMNVSAAADGKRAAVTIHEGPGSDVWMADLERGTLTRLSSEAHNIEPVLSPDGKRVAFCSSRNGPYNLFWAPTDGSAAPEALLVSPRNQYPVSWSPDGRFLVVGELHAETGADLWLLPLDGPRQLRPLLATRFDEEHGVVSPDGRWLAYDSNESGRPEVYVRPFPALAPKMPISAEGGEDPAWSRDGRTLYYLGAKTLQAVSFVGEPVPRASRPRDLFPLQDKIAWDLLGNDRFLLVRGVPGAATPQLNVILDWPADLPRLGASR